jgi:hypothetical protein
MTGAAPYYGGRLSPAQAYAVTHQTPTGGSTSQEPATTAKAGELTDKLATLQQLLDDGVITEEEFRVFRERVLQ